MESFRVWVRPLDYEYLICVDGVENAHWLLERLSGSFVFRSAQPISQQGGSAMCSFQVPCNSQLPFSRFQKVLAAIPEVTFLRVAATH